MDLNNKFASQCKTLTRNQERTGAVSRGRMFHRTDLWSLALDPQRFNTIQKQA